MSTYETVIAYIPPKVAAYLPLSNAGYVYADSWKDAIDVSQPTLWLAIASIIFNPLYWNITARNEYRNHTLRKLLGGSLPATYFFFVTIFSLGILRDHLYQNALRHQPHLAVLAQPVFKGIALALFVSGQVFVVTSIYALGIVGTYLGDYCGILMKERVTGFPFNVLEDPMYVGSTLAFLGTAIWYESPAGIVLSALVWVVYAIALRYEGPFTGEIYSSAAKKAAAAKKEKKDVSAAPQTPRKSSRIADKTDSDVSSSAAATATKLKAAAAEATSNGTATPRRRTRKSVAPSELEGTPQRVTRSRSRAHGSAGEDTD